MEMDKYIGIDTHCSTLVVNVRDSLGKMIVESTVATKPFWESGSVSI